MDQTIYKKLDEKRGEEIEKIFYNWVEWRNPSLMEFNPFIARIEEGEVVVFGASQHWGDFKISVDDMLIQLEER